MNFIIRFADKEKRSFLKYKKVIKISIYGAFSGGRIKKLEKLRDYLRKHGYNARLSIDFIDEYPMKENESEDTYNRRLSEMLNDWGDIHIFVFFYEYKNESNVNQSASMELERTYNLYKSENIVIYFEKKSYEQMRSLHRGLIKKTGWDYDIFDKIEDVLDDAIGFCNNCLHRMHKDRMKQSKTDTN